MKKLKFWMLGLLFSITLNLYSQNTLHIGMTADEFKTKMPGILPDEMKYDNDLWMTEKLDSISGKWTFAFADNVLNSAEYFGDNAINNKADFDKWISSAKSIIDDYSKVYGQPTKYDKGGNIKYVDRTNYDYERGIGKRELFYEASWITKTMNIKISCDYRSNYYEEFKEGYPNGPSEWFKYTFQIAYSSVTGSKDVKPVAVGRFYLGMDVKDFAKVFPSLFPNGVGLTGQWSKNENLYGLNGSWAYEFENGKLTWMHYDKYIDEINEKNFKKCLSATKHLINDYTKLCGNADTTIIGDTTFVDPYKKHHWGYDVIEVRWKDYKDMKISVRFTFMGGKGEYHFIVEMNFFDKTYSYYD